MSCLAGRKPTIWVRLALWGTPLAVVCSLPAHALDLAQVPLFLTTGITPNILVTLDNSQSMDATMAGKVIIGSDPSTRSNIARSVLRDVITNYRFNFNWGLGSFEISGAPSLFTTYGYFLGTAATMVYTNDCTGIVDGVGTSASNGGLECIANPQTANGFSHITFSRSGDDADVNDVTYAGDLGPQLYGIGTTGSKYRLYQNRDSTTNWHGPPTPSFSGLGGEFDFAATDAGFLAKAVDYPRRVWVRRAWGYANDITGQGRINEGVVKSQFSTAAEETAEAAHYAQLMALLGDEDATPASANLKNAAFFTPLAGTLKTARKYYSGVDGHTSPIQGICQKNFVVLATDGNPSGKKDGTQYDPTERVNTKTTDADGNEIWTYGQAVQDVFTEIEALHTTDKDGTKFDVNTYVIGLGDTVANESSVAALNEMANRGGTGIAYLANDSTALATAIEAVIANIRSSTASGSAVAASAQRFDPDDGLLLYQATFDSSDWSGNLRALPVSADGTVGGATWAAATQVNAQNWNSGRTIITYKPSAAIGARGISFRWPVDDSAPTATELDANQVLALNTDAANVNDGRGKLRLRYLRGDTANELRNCVAPGCTANFRNRPATVLGDIVNSAPVYVGPPAAGYLNDFEPTPYSSFTTTHKARTPYVYVGANDGMLHAFDATTGNEKFAYVPSLVFNSLSKLTPSSYSHLYTVDGTPVVADVYYAGAWHTLLVSGLRAGGAGLFALDVTNPSAITEAGASSVVRWEFTDADMGHVFALSPPLKTNNGRWSVIVGNGYNSSSGKAMLFLIDAETGAVVRKIDTGSAGPNGLSAPTAIDISGDGIVDIAYAGDLNGNLWKFDLSNVSPASWAVAGGAELFASGQPITGRPDVALAPKGGYMVVFGTGRYIETGDNSPIGTQSVYGIWDKEDGTTVGIADLQQQAIVAGEVEFVDADGNKSFFRQSTHAVGAPLDSAVAGDNAIDVPTYFSTKRGWSVNLPSSGERVVADAQVRGGRAIFASIIPPAGCDSKGSGWVLEFDLYTGNRFDSAVFDIDNNGILDDADYLLGRTLTGWKTDGVPSSPVFVRFPAGAQPAIEKRYVGDSEGGDPGGPGGPPSAENRLRTMWRVVQ